MLHINVLLDADVAEPASMTEMTEMLKEIA